MVRDRKEDGGEGRRGPIHERHSPLQLYRIAAVVILGRVPDDTAAVAAVPLLVVPSAAAGRRAAAPRRHRHEDDEEEEDAGGAADVDREVLLRDLPRAHAQGEGRVWRRRGGGKDGGRGGGSGRRCGKQGRVGDLRENRGDIMRRPSRTGQRRFSSRKKGRRRSPSRAFLAGGGLASRNPKH